MFYNVGMNKKEMQIQIENKMLELYAQTKEIFNIDVRCVIDYELRGGVAGYAWREDGINRLRFNLDIATNNSENFMTTVIHEFAHIVTKIVYPNEKPHGRHWLHVMIKLGVAHPTRCHSYTYKPARVTKKVACICSGCKRESDIGIIRYNRHLKYMEEKGRPLYRCGLCHSKLIFNV